MPPLLSPLSLSPAAPSQEPVWLLPSQGLLQLWLLAGGQQWPHATFSRMCTEAEMARQDREAAKLGLMASGPAELMGTSLTCE